MVAPADTPHCGSAGAGPIREDRAAPRVERRGANDHLEVAGQDGLDVLFLPIAVQQIVGNWVVEGIHLHDVEADVWELR